jgi:hypothetical protein
MLRRASNELNGRVNQQERDVAAKEADGSGHPAATRYVLASSRDVAMQALTIRQPWSHFVIHCGKRVDNRSWPTKFRGSFLIHAAASVTRHEFEKGLEFATRNAGVTSDKLPTFEQLARGVIVGRARLIDCSGGPQRGDESLWSVAGEYGFWLDDVESLPFVRCRGGQGFWNVPDEVLNQLRTAGHLGQ